MAAKATGTKTKKRLITRTIKWILVLTVLLILLVAFLLPVVVSSDRGRKFILAQINPSIAGRVNFSGLAMGWRKGITITNLSFEDDAGGIRATVKRISTQPHYGTLLSGNLSLGETVIDTPVIEIDLPEPKPPETEGLQPKPSGKQASPPPAMTLANIDLVIKNGYLKITPSKTERVELAPINGKLHLKPLGQESDFEMNAAVIHRDQASPIRVTGQLTPGTKTGWGMDGLSGNLDIDVDDLNLDSLEPFFTLAGMEVHTQGYVSVLVKSNFQKGEINFLLGNITGKALEITSPNWEGDRFQSDALDIDVKLSGAKGLVKIDRLALRGDWIEATVSGAVPTTFDSLEDILKLDSVYDLESVFECDLATALSQMPHVFSVREGMEITSGRLNSRLQTLNKEGRRIISGQASLAGLQGTIKEKTVVLSEPVQAEVEISSNKSGINFDRLDVTSAFAKIHCTGTNERLDYNAEIDLSRLQSQVGAFIETGPYHITGEFLSQGSVSIEEKEITATVSSVLQELRLRLAPEVSVFEPKVDLVFDATIEREKRVLYISALKANASFGQVRIKEASVALNEKSAAPVNLEVFAEADLSKLMPLAKLFTALPKDMAIEGMATTNLSIQAQKESYHLSTEALEIKHLKINLAEQKPFEQNQMTVAFDAEIQPAKQVVTLQIVSPEMKIQGDVQQRINQETTRLEGRVDWDYDWEAVMAAARPFLPEGLTLVGSQKDTMRFSSSFPTGRADQLPANLNTAGKLSFTQASYMGLNFGATELNLQVQKGLLDIAPLTTTVNNGQINLAGRGDFTKKPPLFKIIKPIDLVKEVQINEETTEKLLSYVNPIFANAVNVKGVANFHCERLTIPLGDQAGNELEVIGTLSIGQLHLQASDLLGKILAVVGLSLQGKSMTIHPTRFVLQNGFLRYEDMQIDVGKTPIHFQGVIGVQDKSLNMTVTLPYSMKAKGRGRKISLPLRGTIDQPELDLDKLLQQQLKEQWQKQLSDKLNLEGELGEKILEGLGELFK